jgi:hypothetical protein
MHAAAAAVVLPTVGATILNLLTEHEVCTLSSTHTTPRCTMMQLCTVAVASKSFEALLTFTSVNYRPLTLTCSNHALVSCVAQGTNGLVVEIVTPAALLYYDDMPCLRRH